MMRSWGLAWLRVCVVLPAAGGPLMMVIWVSGLCCHLFCRVRSMRWLLQWEHEALRLVGSHHGPPWLVGMMWSTWVAVPVQPVVWTWHWWLSRWSICCRMRRHGPAYSGFRAMVGSLAGKGGVCRVGAPLL